MSQVTAAASPPEPGPGNPDLTSKLVLRRVAIDTYRENVAYLNRDCGVYRAEGFQHFVIHNFGKIPPKKKLKENDGLGRH